jgi:hypothetical protein
MTDIPVPTVNHVAKAVFASLMGNPIRAFVRRVASNAKIVHLIGVLLSKIYAERVTPHV